MKKETKGKAINKDREFAVILEKVYSEIKVIAEGQSALRDKLDSAVGMVAKNTEDITMLNLNVSVIKGDITKINGKLAHIEESIRSFDKRVSALETVK